MGVNKLPIDVVVNDSAGVEVTLDYVSGQVIVNIGKKKAKKGKK